MGEVGITIDLFEIVQFLITQVVVSLEVPLRGHKILHGPAQDRP